MKKFLLLILSFITGALMTFAQTNLLENGDFESWTDEVPDNWGSEVSPASNATLSQESTTVHSGNYAVKMASASSNRRLASKPLTLSAGTYTLSFYAYGNLVRPGYAIITNGAIADSQNDYVYIADVITLTDSEWTLVSQEFTLEEETTVSIVIMRQKKSTDEGLIIDDVTLTTSDGGTTDPDTGDSEDISNTAESAYTIAESHTIISNGKGLDTEVYVKGIVTSVSNFNSNYGSITYHLGDTDDDDNPLQIYSGLYYNGDMFSSKDDLQVGDEIVVKGTLKSYNGTDEMDKSSVVITHKRNGEDVTPSTPAVDITNTPEMAYSIADAIRLIDAGEGLTTKVYVKGYIVGTPSVSTSYGNATYNISDVKGDESTTITVYRGYYLESAKFTSEDQIAAGDEVIVYGTLTLHNNTTYEINQGNYLYSLNNQASAINNITTSNAEAQKIFSLDGKKLVVPAKGVNIINGKKILVK